jgi:hypothetical protein
MQRVSFFDLRLRGHRCWMVKKPVALGWRRTNPITQPYVTVAALRSTPPLQVTALGQVTYPPWQNHPFHFRQV